MIHRLRLPDVKEEARAESRIKKLHQPLTMMEVLTKRYDCLGELRVGDELCGNQVWRRLHHGEQVAVGRVLQRDGDDVVDVGVCCREVVWYTEARRLQHEVTTPLHQSNTTPCHSFIRSQSCIHGNRTASLNSYFLHWVSIP